MDTWAVVDPPVTVADVPEQVSFPVLEKGEPDLVPGGTITSMLPHENELRISGLGDPAVLKITAEAPVTPGATVNAVATPVT